MSYLLDTHAVLWYYEDSPKLPESIAMIIEDRMAMKYISVATMWEFSIKQSLGKLDFIGGITAFWEMAVANGFILLPIIEPYLREMCSLPFLHRDPFDRLLIATAMVESMTILTVDDNIHKYDVPWAW